MYHRLNEMHTLANLHALKALASALTTGVIQAVKTDILDRQYGHANPDTKYEFGGGAAASHTGEPTLDARNEQDSANAAGSDVGNDISDHEGASGSSNIFGHEVLMPPLHLAELLDGLRQYTIGEIEHVTDSPFFMPQTYKDRLEFLSRDDQTFSRAPGADQEARLKRLLEAGKITQTMVDEANKAAAERYAAPFKANAEEILTTIGSLNDFGPGRDAPPDDSWFERLPFRTQMQLIDKTIAGMARDATTKYTQAATGRGPQGSTPAELEQEAVLLEKETEAFKKWRIQWHKANASKLEHEEELWNNEQTRRALSRLEARSDASQVVSRNGDGPSTDPKLPAPRQVSETQPRGKERHAIAA